MSAKAHRWNVGTSEICKRKQLSWLHKLHQDPNKKNEFILFPLELQYFSTPKEGRFFMQQSKVLYAHICYFRVNYNVPHALLILLKTSPKNGLKGDAFKFFQQSLNFLKLMCLSHAEDFPFRQNKIHRWRGRLSCQPNELHLLPQVHNVFSFFF